MSRARGWLWPGVVMTLLAEIGAGRADDRFGGLPAGPGQEDVFYFCNACHSLQLVTQQRLGRERWDKLLVWMVEEQGMPELEPLERDRVLDYLARHYGQPAQR